MEKQGERVRRNTAEMRNAEIDNRTILNLEFYKSEGVDAIDARIAALDHKWDMERTLELNAACFALAGTLLGAFVHRRWLLLPVVVTAFLAQHAVQGWCPPVPLFRRLGFRTRPEIDREKYALKALRGDFKKANDPEKAWMSVY